MASNDISEAIGKARYNEIVHITVEDGDTTSEIALTACLDEGGGVVWNPLNSSQSSLLSRHLQTKQWIFPMLNDCKRNDLYERGIRQAIGRLQVAPNETVHILDIGCGTGLLGLMAARCVKEVLGEQQPYCVTSMEMSTCMAAIARQTIRDNHLTDQITVVEGHSTELSLETPAHVCISELLEDGFLGEGILPTMRDAWKRHLDPQALVVPRGARIYAQIVTSSTTTSDRQHCTTWMERFFGPHNAPTETAFQELERTKDALEPTQWSLDGEKNLLLPAKNAVVPVHAAKLLADGTIETLSEPFELFQFDFTRPMTEDETSYFETSMHRITVPVAATGRAEGALVWFELDLGESGLTYATHLDDEDAWQDHWRPCLHFFEPRPEVAVGESLALRVAHSEDRIFVEVDDLKTMTSLERNKRRRLDHPLVAPSIMSPLRVNQLNDQERTAAFLRSLHHALDVKTKDALVLDVSDFAVCACFAASLGGTRVVSLESSTVRDVTVSSAKMAQLGNGFPRDGCHFDLLQCHAGDISVESLGGKPADIVVAEYYHIFEGWHIQEALNFSNIMRTLRKNGVVTGSTLIIPNQCRVMACGIESANLRKAYVACGDEKNELMGFDHSYVNLLGGDFSDRDIVLPMWQHQYRTVTEPFEIACLNYRESTDARGETFVATEKLLSRQGQLDALMIWLEFELPGRDGVKALNTLGSGSQQTIRMCNRTCCNTETTSESALQTRLIVTNDNEAGFLLELRLL